jgi:potassium-transporting ATPase KdpC subunit
MKQHLIVAIRFTIVTTIVFGLLYPLGVTGLSKLFFPRQANGSLIERNGRIIGSRLIAQGFTSDKYFHPRPSGAGSGYDPTSSGGSNLGPTNQQLVNRVKQDVAKLQLENPGTPIPPASAAFQTPRVAKARGISEDALRTVVSRHTEARQWGILGEPRVNVLELNLDLDQSYPGR